MIVPLTQESQWLPVLANPPVFPRGDKPMVVISPHPDDETLGAGGLIAAHSRAGGEVLVVAVTDGENAYQNAFGLGEIRRQEQENAVGVLSGGKAKLVRCALTDSGVSNQTQRLTVLLEDHIRPESHVIAPWVGDFHPDHEACGRVALEVARRVGAQISWYFFWTWHRGVPATIAGLNLMTFPLDGVLLSLKLRALECHQSQLEHVSGNPILPDNLLAPARRNFEVFAEA